MDKELLGKEVLGILDTRQIQRFMFRSNSYVDTLGGSDLMVHILPDGILHALHSVNPPLQETEYDLCQDPDAPIRYFEDERVLFQVIICTAGNALFIARTGKLAQMLIRKVSRYYLEHGYSLNLAAAAVEKTEHFGTDIFKLYKKLNAVKTGAVISDPLEALPVVMREAHIGEPVVTRLEETGEYISRSSMLRRQEAARRGEVVSLEDLIPTKGSDGRSYKAVMHVDGNNIGITIGRILQHTPDYQDGIRMRRRVNTNLTTEYRRIMQKTVQDLEAYFSDSDAAGGDFAHHFQVIHANGDDINCMCSAGLAFPFLSFFFSNLKDASLFKSGTKRIPLYCCGGVCFVAGHNDFHTAFSMAEECCESAKATAKKEGNLRDGLAGNWIDFQILSHLSIQNLDLLRERSFTTDSNVSLLLRPYCLDEVAKDQPYAYEKLLHRVKEMKRLEQVMGRARVKRLKQSFLMDRFLFEESVQHLKERGTDLEAILGAPFWRDEEKKTHAAWYDAMQLAPFMA